jgi:hypothetical protein
MNLDNCIYNILLRTYNNYTINNYSNIASTMWQANTVIEVWNVVQVRKQTSA